MAPDKEVGRTHEHLSHRLARACCCAAPGGAGGGPAAAAHGRRADRQQMLPMPQPGHVAGSAPGHQGLGSKSLPDGRARRALDQRGDQADGRISRHELWTGRKSALTRRRPQGFCSSRETIMRDLVVKYLSKGVSRRNFVTGLTKAGLTMTAAQSVLSSVSTVTMAQTSPTATGPVKPFEGHGGAAFAEQLIASGVKYVFGNSASEDAQFYEALVDRPQLKYILTPHEGPGAAMAAGYIKASGEPAIVMQAGVVGMANAIGQMFNAHKEQTPLVVYSYRTDQSRRAGRDGFEEVLNQEQMVQPITKYTWLARRGDMIPETVRRAFKAAWTPPYGPSYISWHSDFNDEKVKTEIIPEDQVDPRMRVRPNTDDVQRAAKLLVEAKMPLMVVGDEIYKAKAAAKAVKLAELLGMPVTQVRQLYANFPEGHPLWVGNLAGGNLNSLPYPKGVDVVINVGNKFQH